MKAGHQSCLHPEPAPGAVWSLFMALVMGDGASAAMVARGGRVAMASLRWEPDRHQQRYARSSWEDLRS